jgi:hypothetical protein
VLARGGRIREALGAPERAGIGAVLAHRRAAFRKVGVVVVEALAPAEAWIEHEAGDEGAGAPAVRTKDLGQRVRGIGQRLAVAQHAVPLRLLAGEERRVAGGRRRRGRERALEERAFLREAVEGRRRERSTVGAERVGAQRVHGDEHDVRREVAGARRQEQERAGCHREREPSGSSLACGPPRARCARSVHQSNTTVLLP